MAYKVDPFKIPLDYVVLVFGFIKLQDTLPFLRKCRHLFDCSASSGISLQLHLRALNQNFDSLM
jgi:hypothetical protein